MNDKTNKIPLKGHPNRCRYWRDKKTLADLEALEQEISWAIEDSKGEQLRHFKIALDHLHRATVRFKAGWSYPYNT